MINNFNFHGNIYLNFGCKKCNQSDNNTGCGSYVNNVTLDFETGLIFDINGSTGAYVNVEILPETQPSAITECAVNNGTHIIPLSSLGGFTGFNGILKFNFSNNNDCTNPICVVEIPYNSYSQEVPISGDDTIFVPVNLTECDNESFAELFSMVGNATLNTNNGHLTITAGETDGVVIYYMLCDGHMTDFVIVSVGNPQTRYSCAEAICIEDENGNYTNSNCDNQCNGGPERYSCRGNDCVFDPEGIYFNSWCNGQCNQPITMYSCSGQQCIEDENGLYNNSNCDWECESITLLATITFDDIANSPVPGNDVNDWNYFLTTHNTIYEFLASNIQIIGNTIYFSGQKSKSTQFAYTDSNPNITSINIDGLTNLKDLRFYTQNPLNLDISNNLELVFIGTNANIVLPVLPDLVYLYSGTGSLDMSNIVYCTLLEEIVVVNNSSLLPTHIGFNNNPNLNFVRVLGGNVNNDTIQVDLSNLLLLDFVELSNNTGLTTVITTGANIRHLQLSSYVLTNVNFATNTTLERLEIFANVSQLDLTYNTNLNFLKATGMYPNNGGIIGLSNVLLPPVNNLSTILFYYCNLPDSVINYILANIVANSNAPGSVELNGPNMGVPTGQGITDLNALGELGWPIGTNLQGLTMYNFSVLPSGITTLTSLSEWNTFFDLPANGTPFTAISRWFSHITLHGGSNITIKSSLFSNNGVFNSIIDDTNCIIAVEDNAFNINNLTSIILPAAATIGDSAFANTQAIIGVSIDIRGCTSLGSTSGDNGVFANIIGSPWVTLFAKASLATNNGGNPDGDIQYLTSNNPVTVNYI